MTEVIRNTKVAVIDPPQLPPYPHGIYEHVSWLNSGDPARFLIEDGVVIRPANFGGESSFGVWGAKWSTDPDDLDPVDDVKTGSRPVVDESEPFTHETVFGFDQNYVGNLRADERAAVEDRALRSLLRHEQMSAEKQLAARMLADVGTPAAATSLKDAFGQITDAIAALGISGALVHGRPYWLAQEPGLFDPDRLSRLGFNYVAGGGYVDTLDDVLVVTSPIFGWRGDTATRTALKHRSNQFAAVAERSVLLGYEQVIAAVEIN